MSNTLDRPSLIETRLDRGNFIECRRYDGLKVFLGKGQDEATRVLNEVREFGTRDQVFAAYLAIRGLLQTRDYARKHGTPEEEARIDQDLDMVLDRFTKELRIPEIGGAPAMMDITRDEAVALCRLVSQRIEHIQEHIVGAGEHVGTITRRRYTDEIDLLEGAANKLSVFHDIEEDELYRDQLDT